MYSAANPTGRAVHGMTLQEPYDHALLCEVKASAPMAHDTPFSARTMPRVRGDDLGRGCDRMVGDRYLVSERSGGGVRGVWPMAGGVGEPTRAVYSWVLQKTKGKEARDGEEDYRRLGRGRQEGGCGSGGAGRGAVGAVEVDGGAGEGAGGEADGVRVVGGARGRPGSGGGAGGGPPGLEAAAEGDRSDCGAANAQRCCRGQMRYAGRERSATETALGRVRLAMGRYARACPAGRARVRGRRAWTSRGR